MMRFINEVYNGDKERFYLAGQKSSRKNSRFISANRIGIPMMFEQYRESIEVGCVIF